MSDEPVTLELLGRLVRGLQDQMADFRDQMTVQMAILMRLEAAQNSMAEQLRDDLAASANRSPAARAR